MNFKLVGIGEVLWDLLPGGRQLGGAPANFAYHARMLGADSCVISRVGSDNHGHDLLHRLQQLGVPTDCIEIDPEAPTGTVSVEVTPGGQPCFTIHEHVAWDRIAGEEPARLVVAEANAICFGTLAQRCEVSRTAIRRLIRSTPSKAWRVLDVNLRQHFYSREIIEQSLALANVLKVNDAELPLIGEMFGLAGDPRSQLAALAARFQLRVAACTRGALGSLLLAGGRWSDHPGIPATIVDTVGAGDSFTAAMTLGLLAGWDLDEVNLRANQIAACVASSAGGTPELPSAVRSPFLAIETSKHAPN